MVIRSAMDVRPSMGVEKLHAAKERRPIHVCCFFVYKGISKFNPFGGTNYRSSRGIRIAGA
jgi:hypothetical protein